MDYTICEKVIELAKQGNKYTADLLFPLTSTGNPHKVILNDHILDRYSMHSTEFISTWLHLLTVGNFKKMIDIEVVEGDNIFIKTCNASHDKQFIVREREDYDKNLYDNLNVLNCEEAIVSLQAPAQVIYQIGNGNQVSTGNQSPNTH